MIDYSQLAVRIEPMNLEDIGRVLEIERGSFSSPWSARAYEYELRYNDMAHYFVARTQSADALARAPRAPLAWLTNWFRPPTPNGGTGIIGYVGFWMMAG